MGLSPAVAAAVGPAVDTVATLVAQLPEGVRRWKRCCWRWSPWWSPSLRWRRWSRAARSGATATWAGC